MEISQVIKQLKEASVREPGRMGYEARVDKSLLKEASEMLERYKDALDEMVDADVKANLAYESGMNDAWEIAKRIVLIVLYPEESGVKNKELVKIFGARSVLSILKNNTAFEAKRKIDAWEKSKAEIHVGDVVANSDGEKIVVTDFSLSNDVLNGIVISHCKGRQGCAVWGCPIEEFKKTGKHFDFSQLFALAGDSDGSK